VGPLRLATHIDQQGVALFEEISARGLEGIMAKKADSPYRGGRFPDWLKIRVQRTGDFVVVGYAAPKRATRTGFSALHIGIWDGGALKYAGKVGTGFTEQDLIDIHARLQPLRRPKPACVGDMPRGAAHTWVEPVLVCEVRYKDWNPGGHVREPAFLRFRDDK